MLKGSVTDLCAMYCKHVGQDCGAAISQTDCCKQDDHFCGNDLII